ncbi:MAG: beta strand repeat-containing protein, partial [Luteibaculaceae bacterium]
MISRLLAQKVSLVLFLMFCGGAVWGQLTLPGTSPYTQNFNSIGSGLPTGWTVRTGATNSEIGNTATLTTTATNWNNTTGNFRNVASSNNLISSASATDQSNSTDRALGVRQTNGFGDPGAAFEFNIENTLGKINFSLSLKHQMLDVQPRSTTWTVQYSTNGGSVWTSLGTYTDPGVFGSTNATYSFGNAIDNNPNNILIRVVALAGSTGSGSRDTYAIDDFELSWSPLTPPTITLSSPNQIMAASVDIGTNNHILSQFQAEVTVSNTTLNSLSFSTTGSYLASDITGNFQLWYGTTNSFATATSIASTASGAPATFEFTGLSQQINQGTTGFFWLTANIGSSAVVGRTIQISQNPTLTFSAGTPTGTIDAGGIQTFSSCSPSNVTGLSLAAGNTVIQVSWTSPPCFDDILIVIAEATNTGIPTGTNFTTNLNYTGNGDILGNGKVVYQGTTSPQTITGLTNGTTYFIKVFTRKGSTWSSGIENSATPVEPIYSWIGANNSSWNVSTNWSPTRALITNNDLLKFNDGTTKTLVGIQAQSIGKIEVTNNTNITFTAGTNRVVTIEGISGEGLFIEAGSKLALGTGSNIVMDLALNVSAQINGELEFFGGGHALISFTPSSIIFKNNSKFTANGTGNPFGFATSSAGSVIFEANSNFIYLSGGNPFVSVANAITIFQEGSNYFHLANTAPSLSGRNYGNLILDNSAANLSNLTGMFPLNIRNLIIESGAWNINLTGGINISGNLTVNGGTLGFSPATPRNLTLNGTAQQNISGAGTLNFGANTNLVVNNSAGVTLNRDIVINGSLTLNSGIVNTGNHKITLAPAATLIGENEDNYITGTIETTRDVTTANNTFGGIGIEIDPELAMGSTKVTRITGSRLTGINGNQSLLRYFQVEPTTNGTEANPLNASVFFRFLPHELELAGVGGNADFNDLALFKRDIGAGNDSWAVIPNGTNTANSITVDNIVRFSEIALADAVNAPLPVELLHFGATALNREKVLVNWSTAAEINNNYFLVERSHNARDFELV